MLKSCPLLILVVVKHYFSVI